MGKGGKGKDNLLRKADAKNITNLSHSPFLTLKQLLQTAKLLLIWKIIFRPMSGIALRWPISFQKEQFPYSTPAVITRKNVFAERREANKTNHILEDRKMKKSVMILAVAVVGLAVAAGSQAQASVYVSTFNVTQADFSLTGFADATPGNTILLVDNVTGSYNLNIPPAGGSWDVYVSASLWADFDKGGPALPMPLAFTNQYVGTYASSGPSTSWGPGGPIPFTYTYDPGTGPVVLDLDFLYDVDLDGTYPSDSFGVDAYAEFTYGGPDIAAFNTYLTMLDAVGGGGDGVIDGWIGGEITVTAIPEPASVLVWCLLGAGSWLGMRVCRRGRRVGRQPWSDENRTAILEVIDHGRA